MPDYCKHGLLRDGLRHECGQCAGSAHETRHRLRTLLGLSNQGLNEHTTKLEADARALWAVRVLDAWSQDAGPVDSRYWSSNAHPESDLHCYCDTEGTDWTRIVRRGPTQDAARLAAARAVFPSLPESVRQELGEEP